MNVLCVSCLTGSACSEGWKALDHGSVSKSRNFCPSGQSNWLTLIWSVSDRCAFGQAHWKVDDRILVSEIGPKHRHKNTQFPNHQVHVHTYAKSSISGSLNPRQFIDTIFDLVTPLVHTFGWRWPKPVTLPTMRHQTPLIFSALAADFRENNPISRQWDGARNAKLENICRLIESNWTILFSTLHLLRWNPYFAPADRIVLEGLPQVSALATAASPWYLDRKPIDSPTTERLRQNNS